MEEVAFAKEQPAWLPKFTKVGFMKTKIPPDVYAMMLWEYERKNIFLSYSHKDDKDDGFRQTGCPSQCNKTNRFMGEP